MSSRKTHVNKEKSSVYDSGLFGIIDKAESADQMISSEAGSSVVSNFKLRSATRTAVLEAAYRKAQAITLTRQMYYV